MVFKDVTEVVLTHWEAKHGEGDGGGGGRRQAQDRDH